MSERACEANHVVELDTHGACRDGCPVSDLARAGRRARLGNAAFKWMLFGCIAVGIVFLGALLVDVIVKAWPRLDMRVIRRFPSGLPERAGAQSAILGTVWVVG